MDIITGQLQVGPPECPQHRETAHDAEGLKMWCGRCGWTHKHGGVRMAPPNGGWA